MLSVEGKRKPKLQRDYTEEASRIFNIPPDEIMCCRIQKSLRFQLWVHHKYFDDFIRYWDLEGKFASLREVLFPEYDEKATSYKENRDGFMIIVSLLTHIPTKKNHPSSGIHLYDFTADYRAVNRNVNAGKYYV